MLLSEVGLDNLYTTADILSQGELFKSHVADLLSQYPVLLVLKYSVVVEEGSNGRIILPGAVSI